MEEREIVICKTCSGHGEIYWDEMVNYHKREYETHYRKCERCNGKGRLIKIISIQYNQLP